MIFNPKNIANNYECSNLIYNKLNKEAFFNKEKYIDFRINNFKNKLYYDNFEKTLNNCGKISNSDSFKIIHLQKKKKKKVMVLTGASGEMGPGLIEEALKNHYHVVACTRNISKKAFQTSLITYQHTPEKVLEKAEFWKMVVSERLNDFDEILFVNTIGCAVPPKGKTLEDINLKTVLAMAEGMNQIAKETIFFKKIHFAHISSIAASILGENHEYSRVKNEGDQRLMNDFSHLRTTVLRAGLVFNNMSINNFVNMKHPYSPEQLASLPIQFSFGTGNQTMQPVFDGDIYRAIFNGAKTQAHGIFNAVGPEAINVKEMLEFFRKLQKKKIRHFSVPYEIGHFLAKYFPKGRIAPYSVALFEYLEQCDHKFDSLEFKKLVGKDLTSMEETYTSKEGEIMVCARPPILDHLVEIKDVLRSNGQAREELIQILKKHGLNLSINLLKSFW